MAEKHKKRIFVLIFPSLSVLPFLVLFVFVCKFCEYFVLDLDNVNRMLTKRRNEF